MRMVPQDWPTWWLGIYLGEPAKGNQETQRGTRRTQTPRPLPTRFLSCAYELHESSVSTAELTPPDEICQLWQRAGGDAEDTSEGLH